MRIAEILKDEGFIKNFRVLEDGKQGMLRVYLKYGTANEKMISGLVRVSTPGPPRLRRPRQDPVDPGRHGRGRAVDVARAC